MTITEGLKELKLIEKKLKKNKELLAKYSSQPSNEKPYFGTEEEQRKEIKSILQSSEDLVIRYTNLHGRITRTNLKTVVQFNGEPYTIDSLLQIKRTLANLMIDIYKSLNDNNYYNMISSYKTSSFQQNNDLSLVRFYNEKDKQESIRKWEDFYNEIDSRLETINATTNLID